MGYQESREKRIQIFEDTSRLWEEAVIHNDIKNSRSHTVLYQEPLKELSDVKLQRFGENVNVTVTKRRSLEAAQSLREQYQKARIGVLNFASAVNPGGGVVRGSSAQEECLCRCSTLYPCLQMSYLKENYYDYHRKQHNSLYTNRCIYTPDVVALKADTEFPVSLKTSERFKVDVISCAAPNISNNRIAAQAGMSRTASERELRELLETRIDGIMRVGAANQIDVLVLGAFGCGVFGNDPVMVAECFRTVLKRYRQTFCEVEFAVYCPPSDDRNYQAFCGIISDFFGND